MTKPFTYHICWSKYNIHYYGSKTAKGCSPEDLWKTYFTSSKKVHEIREDLGEPDIIEVRKIFCDREYAVKWEEQVLRRLGVLKRDDWINNCIFPLHDNRGSNHPLFNKHHSEKTKKKISESVTGYRHTRKAKQKISVSNLGNKKAIGNKHSENTKNKISLANTGLKRSDETKRKMSIAMKNHFINLKHKGE